MSLHDELAAPFPIGELKFYPVALTQDKQKGKVGSYIDARAVMDRLDAVVGIGNWSTAYRCIDPADKAVECTLSLLIEESWIARSDVGYPNEAKDANSPDKEPWKAAYSDALKRAAVQWGIGRYIYSLELEKEWLPVDANKRFTEQPRIKGATQQAPATARSREVDQPVRPAAATPPEPLPVTTRRGSLMEIAAQMGFSRDEVINTCQVSFENRMPSQLSKAEAQKLLVILEDKKKEAVPA